MRTVTINETAYPVVSEGNTKVLCLDETGEKFAIDKSDLRFSLLESGELNEASASVSVVNKGVDKDGLLLVVNGANYHYTSKDYTPKQLEDKFVGIAKHSVGKAYAWIKKNAKSKESYKKVKESSVNESELDDEMHNSFVDIFTNLEIPGDFSTDDSIGGNGSLKNGTGKASWSNEVAVYVWDDESSDDIEVDIIRAFMEVTGKNGTFKVNCTMNSKTVGVERKSYEASTDDFSFVENAEKWVRDYCKKFAKKYK